LVIVSGGPEHHEVTGAIRLAAGGVDDRAPRDRLGLDALGHALGGRVGPPPLALATISTAP